MRVDGLVSLPGKLRRMDTSQQEINKEREQRLAREQTPGTNLYGNKQAMRDQEREWEQTPEKHNGHVDAN